MAHDITKDVIGCKEFEVQKLNLSGEEVQISGPIKLPLFTDGSIIFNGSNLTQDNSNLFWNVGRTQLESNLIKITSDGTQAAPALKFNDTNTGFFKVGDSVRLSLNNSTILIMNATGLDMNTHKIIGVVDPTANQEAATKKYVDDNDSDTTDHTALSNIGTNTHAQIDTHLADNSQAHSDYMLNTGDTASGNYNFDSGTFFIDSATNKVGIGTTTPQRMLHAHGVLIRASGAAIAGIEMNVGTSSTPNVDWDMFTLGDDLVFRERKGADNTRMTLKAGGFVGIGTTNPGQRLDIGNGTGTHVIRVNAAAAGTAAHIFSQAGTEVGRISFPASTTMTFSIGAGVATSMTISSAGGVSVLGDFKAGTIFSDATIENPKAKMTTLGGYAIKLTNRTGANSVAGHVVTSDSANNDAVVKVIQNVPNATGVFLDSGVANGAEAWVVITG
ncbi:hypothetical protein LCGC14_2532440, partial [marine sediment metagenome]